MKYFVDCLPVGDNFWNNPWPKIQYKLFKSIFYTLDLNKNRLIKIIIENSPESYIFAI